ncbi:MAG: hypothetical protein IT427_09990 [Pirellulales bacterium]|nr:hypothetical protein [Pirellulales bacterium]
MPKLRINLVLIGLAALLSGCSSSADPTDEKAAVVQPPTTPAPTAPAPSKVAAKPSQTRDFTDPKATTAQATTYNPPFPERVDLFEPSKRAENSVRRDDEHGDTVELKGFINVDQPRVVLSIDGVVSPIPEGGEKYGVQVIRIQAPSVDLRRNGRNWRATLE